MKPLEKPQLEVAAHFSYTAEELASLSEILERVFVVEIRREEEFPADGTEPIITFVFSGISSGFFQSIGEYLWNRIKERLAYLVAKKSIGEGDTSHLEFSIKNNKKTIKFKVPSSNAKIIKKAIEQFPKALEAAEEEGFKTDRIEYDTSKEKWKP